MLQQQLLLLFFYFSSPHFSPKLSFYCFFTFFRDIAPRAKIMLSVSLKRSTAVEVAGFFSLSFRCGIIVKKA
jgi:hypothetical protein